MLHAPRYALILIDEIDLFGTWDALKRCRSESCRCIVLPRSTSSLYLRRTFHPSPRCTDKMCIYSLNRVPDKTIVFPAGYSYEAMCHITGEQERPISFYVEDDVAEQR